ALLRGFQRAVQVRLAGVRDAADLLAGGRIEDGERAAVGGILPLAIDEELGVGVGHGLSLSRRNGDYAMPPRACSRGAESPMQARACGAAYHFRFRAAGDRGLPHFW